MPLPPQINNPSIQAVLLQEQKSMSPGEIRILQMIRNKKLLFIVSSYCTFLAILALGWLYGGGRSARWGEEEVRRYRYVAPIVIAFFFIVLTIYFVNYYLKSLYPYIKDIKRGVKELLYFEPDSYKTPFFDTYYIRTVSKKNSLVRISKELYDAIQPGCKACMAISPAARFVFSIDVNGKKMEFNEKNALIDQ